MSTAAKKTLEENNQYSFVLSDEKETILLFTWKHVPGLSGSDFQAGIAAYAKLCEIHKPTKAVIDASSLDQASQAIAWLRGNNDGMSEDYNTWWTRAIVPVYHKAGILALSVATGDPNAPGELPNVPPGVEFKIGYFPDLDAAMSWEVKETNAV